MNLAKLAMRRPVALLVVILGLLLGFAAAVKKMPRDIFPALGVPTLYVAQPFGGMSPEQMEGFLTYYYEYHFLYITGIEHVESKSIQGASLIKLQFHPGTDMSQAMAETVSYVNRARAFMPPGTVPPFIMRFDAGSVPVGTLVFTSETRTVGEMQDMALNRVRPYFATLAGVSAPPPFGGSARTIVVEVDPARLRASGLSPEAVISTLASANQIVPAGNMALDGKYPMVPLNSVVRNVKDLERVPLKPGAYPAVFLRDVATVTDGSDIITSYALVNGRRTVYIPVTKRADASTLSVVNLVKANLPRFQEALPDDVRVSYEFDQSPYVVRAIRGLMTEAALGAVFTGLMILLFLRDWRSVLIVLINIPLSLAAATAALWMTGQTMNIMTLGGLALAVGVLVDEATVCVENIHSRLASGMTVAKASYEGTTETAGPRFMAMLCVLAILGPAFFMTGAARGLFVPLALAVGFSMLASFILSGTLVPVLSVWLLAGHEGSVHKESWMDGLRRGYCRLLGRVVGLRWVVVIVYFLACGLVGITFIRKLGVDLFPRVDSGQIQVRFRAQPGTQVTKSEELAKRLAGMIADEAGRDQVAIWLGFVGVHASSYPINNIYLWNGGPEEGVVQVQLKSNRARRMDAIQENVRARAAMEMPGVTLSFEPGDIVSRVMSFGAQTPIEVAFSSPSLPATAAFATAALERLKTARSLRDVQLGQVLDYPTVEVQLDRERAGLLGVRTEDAGKALVTATGSSRFIVPNYWADPNSGIAYQVQVQIPQSRMNSMEDLRNLPVGAGAGRSALLRNIASVTPGTAPEQFERYNMQRVVSVRANLAPGVDLGAAAAEVRTILAGLGTRPARLTETLRGQITPLTQIIDGLRQGLLVAIVVILLVLAAAFQSFRLGLIAIATVPAALAGVVVFLVMSHGTLNLQSYMGAIMAVGVSVANSILLVSFAEKRRNEGTSAQAAAVESGGSRLRPVLMTSLAMIAGMIPMALGLGEGGEQSAPLGVAVVGGLAFATVASLLVVPALFAIVQQRARIGTGSLDPNDPASRFYTGAAITNSP